VRGASTWRGTVLEQRLDSRHLSTVRLLSRGGEWFVRVAAAPWHQVQYAATALRAHGADVTLFPVLP
jgi:hypothetical protein